MTTSKESWHTGTHKMDRNPPIKSQSMTFSTRWSKLLFPKRSAKIIDDSENLQRQLVFEPHNSLFSFLKSVVTKFTTEAVWNLVLTTGGSLSSSLSSSYKFQHPMYYVRKAILAELKEKPSSTLWRNFLLKTPLLTNTSASKHAHTQLIGTWNTEPYPKRTWAEVSVIM